MPLLACFACRKTFRVSGHEPGSDRRCPSCSAPLKHVARDALIGATVGGCKIEAVIGRGGMGTVYRATQTSVGRSVALKILDPKLSSEASFRARFDREARAAAAVSHPNIVSVFDVGEDEDVNYLVMEVAAGANLDVLLQDEKHLSEDEALSIVRQVADALQHLEPLGLVHRDVKPSNIIYDREEGRARLADFGLARPIADDQVAVTKTGVSLGTPYYMSPEQVRGEKQLDIATDVYALGGTLFHLLTGEAPFDGESSAVVMSKHLRAQVPNPRRVRPAVSASAAKLVRKMMAKSPSARPSPAQVVSMVETIEGGDALESGSERPRATSSRRPRPTGATRATSRPGSQNAIMAGAVVGGALLLIVAVVATSGGEKATEPAPEAPEIASGEAATPDDWVSPVDEPVGDDPVAAPPEVEEVRDPAPSAADRPVAVEEEEEAPPPRFDVPVAPELGVGSGAAGTVVVSEDEDGEEDPGGEDADEDSEDEEWRPPGSADSAEGPLGGQQPLAPEASGAAELPPGDPSKPDPEPPERLAPEPFDVPVALPPLPVNRSLSARDVASLVKTYLKDESERVSIIERLRAADREHLTSPLHSAIGRARTREGALELAILLRVPGLTRSVKRLLEDERLRLAVVTVLAEAGDEDAARLLVERWEATDDPAEAKIIEEALNRPVPYFSALEDLKEAMEGMEPTDRRRFVAAKILQKQIGLASEVPEGIIAGWSETRKSFALYGVRFAIKGLDLFEQGGWEGEGRPVGKNRLLQSGEQYILKPLPEQIQEGNHSLVIRLLVVEGDETTISFVGDQGVWRPTLEGDLWVTRTGGQVELTHPAVRRRWVEMSFDLTDKSAPGRRYQRQIRLMVDGRPYLDGNMVHNGRLTELRLLAGNSTVVFGGVELRSK